jgi:L,D-peptidoglycan transpeptidase YkuD (ErfK/YbiS/YcfS/YnhG family)
MYSEPGGTFVVSTRSAAAHLPLMTFLLRSMLLRSLVATAIVGSGIASVPQTVSPATVPAAQVVLDGVPVDVSSNPQQVITVNRTSGSHARIVMWRKTSTGWAKKISSTNARIGYGGVVPASQRVQGSGATPLGTFSIPFTFGSHSRHSDWNVPYVKYNSGDYWVGDNNSSFYNRYRNKSQGGFAYWDTSSSGNSSERLASYPTQYEMAFVTSFNYYDRVRHRGTGIFLHVNGSGATAGCVSAPRWYIADLMNRLDPGLRPVIAIGA